MATSPTSKRSDRHAGLVGALASLAIAACGAPPPPVTAVTIPDAPRRPDGVVVEPPAALPGATEHAEARGVVALREPLGGEAVASVVRAFFRAFEREEMDTLRTLVTEDAAPLGASRAARFSLIEQWASRMKSFDYSRLAGSEIARVDRMERWSFTDLEGPGHHVERPADMHPGDLLVRVPVTTPRVGSEQLFGDVVVLLLRREGRAFKIAGFGEESSP